MSPSPAVRVFRKGRREKMIKKKNKKKRNSNSLFSVPLSATTLFFSFLTFNFSERPSSQGFPKPIVSNSNDARHLRNKEILIWMFLNLVGSLLCRCFFVEKRVLSGLIIDRCKKINSNYLFVYVFCLLLGSMMMIIRFIFIFIF